MAPIIAATAESAWHRLIPLLQAAGLSDPTGAEVKPENLEARQRDADSPAALIFYTRPEKILAHAMERDEDPAPALAAWSASAVSVVLDCRRRATMPAPRETDPPALRARRVTSVAALSRSHG